MSCPPHKSTKILSAGIAALVIAMGVSRFAYTPLLPIMQSEAGLSVTFAGYLASINYAGYLLGALWMTWHPPEATTRQLRQQLLINIFTTALMACTDMFMAWAAMRLIAGFSSAMIFVLASGIVLEHLALHQRQGWSGWLYSSIGSGIVITALTVPPLGAHFGWQGSWLGLGILSFLIAYPAYYWLDLPHTASPPVGRTPARRTTHGMLPWLTGAYFCAGFGYIVTGTFLVAMLQRIPELAGSSTLAWLIVGLAAAPSSILWMRFGLPHPSAALITAHLAQALGIILPVIWPTLTGTLLGALFYGGTFMGIVTLSMHFGRSLTPTTPHRTIGMLTAAFGAGQILGPTVAGWVVTWNQSFTPALYVAASIVLLGALLLSVGALRSGRN